MVAITHPASVRLAPRRNPRPQLPAVYRRRRLAVLGLVLLVVALASLAGHLLAGPSGAPPTRAVARTTVVVSPGDTVWSIASSLAPGTDPRPVVDAIVEANGGSTLVAGQRLEIVVP
jgi:hypothetical protein